MFSQNIIPEPKHFEIFLLNNEFIHFTEFCSSEKETLGQRLTIILTIILVVIGLFYRFGTISHLIDKIQCISSVAKEEGCTVLLYYILYSAHCTGGGHTPTWICENFGLDY